MIYIVNKLTNCIIHIMNKSRLCIVKGPISEHFFASTCVKAAKLQVK